ncbi:hypothetical protein 1 [Hubei sobemo-like virus 47]|uniref:hypothetical protein 1 n=1 Tax=Hubei sobemo-like virus 47 TaxID=1923235 RepID=UPI000909C4DD|nr:hypothetical protein 1 [Hubei sobemo-like virus 47]APG75840.1 hypothetical protein 1 [Hubei sobemo-like virus 47]
MSANSISMTDANVGVKIEPLGLIGKADVSEEAIRLFERVLDSWASRKTSEGSAATSWFGGGFPPIQLLWRKIKSLIGTKKRFAMVALSAYLLWFVKNHRKSIWSIIRRLMDFVVPGFKSIRSYVTGKVEVIQPSTQLETRESVLESIREGSLLTPMSMPKVQVLVGQMKNGEFCVHGCGVRMELFLVMPDHVWSYSQLESETKRVWLLGPRKGKPMEVTFKEIEIIDTDLVYTKLSPDEWSMLAVGVSTLYHEVQFAGSYAAIVGPMGLGSTGLLRHDSTVFGRVVYDGSTTGGFSGAAYVVAGRLAGVHQRGGPVNGGYSASYIWVTLCAMEKLKQEATEDWLRNSFKNKKRVRVDQSWKDLDTVRVQVDGQYAIIDKDSMRKTFGKNWNEELSSFKVPKSLGYADAEEFESGEVKSSKGPGALNVLDRTQEEVSSPVHVLTAGFKQLSDQEQREVIGQLSDLRKTINTRRLGRISKRALSSIVEDTSEGQQI